MPTISGRSQIDFGSTPGKSHATLTVAAPDILADSDVEARLIRKATSDHTEDEHSIVPITVSAGDISAGTSFAVHAVLHPEVPSGDGVRLTGRWFVAWSYTT